MLPEDLRDPEKVEAKFFELADQMAAGNLKALCAMHDFTLRCSYEMTELSVMLSAKILFLIWVAAQAIREVWYNLGNENPIIPPAGVPLLEEFSGKLGQYVLRKGRDMGGEDLLSRAIIILFKLFFLCDKEGERGTKNWLSLE
ncbi:MAG: hypothetical protein WC858_01665 [Parcubacteria group bacterium]|jgi:hypothetical protein